MNLPSGNLLLSLDVLDTMSFNALLSDLIKKNFFGYVVVTINGVDGLEEGSIVFENGSSVAASYEFIKHDKKVSGDASLELVFNAVAAQHGVIEVYELKKDQVQIILALNDDSFKLKKLLDEKVLEEQKASEFNKKLFARYIDAGKTDRSKVSTKDILRKYGLSSMIGTDLSKKDIVKDLVGKYGKKEE
ncbi:MAG: DUF2226 domain-containing protein [Candidatus Diapherotrites archaeon]|nr:DUF2226 domain-containing protein [Candidatus Diapherotrites archaeon]